MLGFEPGTAELKELCSKSTTTSQRTRWSSEFTADLRRTKTSRKKGFNVTQQIHPNSSRWFETVMRDISKMVIGIRFEIVG